MSTTDASVLGLGAMGTALALRLLATDHSVTVWNRTALRAEKVADAGAQVANSVKDAVDASTLVVVCLLDEASVHEQLDPVVDLLEGRVVVNVTTTTPAESRALATWANHHRIVYVDGGIMATPDLIGGPESTVLYSGDETSVERYRTVLESFGRVEYVGNDAGAAALYDTAMLGAMYAMFAGFEQGGRMVRTGGGSAAKLAEMVTPFLQATAAALSHHARYIDSPGRYEPVQSTEFTGKAIDLLNRSAADADQTPDLLAATRVLLTDSIT